MTRYADQEYRWKNFIWTKASKDWHPWGMILSSGDHDNQEGVLLTLQLGPRTLWVELPQWVLRPIAVPQLRWTEYRERAYGWSYSEGFLQVFRGARTMDSSTDRTWGWFLPWTQWKQVRHAVWHKTEGWLEVPNGGDIDFKIRHFMLDNLPRTNFTIRDGDGTLVQVSTYVEHRRWRKGTGAFKWLGHIWPQRKSTSLVLEFSPELGPGKHDWKGGIVGHSIELKPGEASHAAMRRYCAQGLRYKGLTYLLEFVE